MGGISELLLSALLLCTWVGGWRGGWVGARTEEDGASERVLFEEAEDLGDSRARGGDDEGAVPELEAFPVGVGWVSGWVGGWMGVCVFFL